jgi:signal transduction histidine kinase
MAITLRRDRQTPLIAKNPPVRARAKTTIWGYEPLIVPADDVVVEESVALLSHEMRNLIATFVGFTELLISQDWPRERQVEYLETMREEGRRMEQFLQDLMDLERIEAGALGLKPRSADLGELLDYAATIAAHDPTHPVRLTRPPDLSPVLVEPDRIQQVVGNLLSNARKYSPAGGPICLSARRVKNHLEVSVQDNGVGIPADALPNVFEKFFRVSSLGHHGIRGAGLGLAICQRIIEGHGGRIWAESEGEGRGARFTFTLPLAPVGRQRSPTSTSGTAARLSSRGEHVPAHQGNDRHASGVSRPATAQPPRRARASVLAGDCPAAD